MGIFFAFYFHQSCVAQQLDPKIVFQPSETVSYKIQYQWGFIWVDAGRVQFSVDTIAYQNKTAYQFQGKGKTLKKWDWMYRVNDVYQSAATYNKELDPLFFYRKVEEGKSFTHNYYQFNKSQNKINAHFINQQNDTTHKTIAYQNGISDVMSMIYKARLLPYENIKKNGLIKIKLILDGEIHSTHIKYLGIESIETENNEKIDCYKFKPMLIEGSIFKAGDEMIVWVSRDKNRVPILVETPILVGSIKATFLSAKNLLYPLKFDE